MNAYHHSLRRISLGSAIFILTTLLSCDMKSIEGPSDLQQAALPGTVITYEASLPPGSTAPLISADMDIPIRTLSDGFYEELTATPIRVEHPLQRGGGPPPASCILRLDVGGKPDKVIEWDEETGLPCYKPFLSDEEGNGIRIKVDPGKRSSLALLRNHAKGENAEEGYLPAPNDMTDSAPSTQAVSMPLIRADSSSRALAGSDAIKPFWVTVNDGSTIEVFLNKDYFADPYWWDFSYQVTAINVVTNSVTTAAMNGSYARMAVPKSGSYHIVVNGHYRYRKWYWWFFKKVYYYTSYYTATLWKHTVHTERSLLSASERASLAARYAPVVVKDSAENYNPSSLQYIFNKESVDPSLDSETFHVARNNQSYPEGVDRKIDTAVAIGAMANVLPYWGHSDSWLDVFSASVAEASRMRFRTNTGDITNPPNPVIYYSFEERPDSDRIYINYHFLFPYDCKDGTPSVPGRGSHLFDRESITMVLDRMYNPLSVIFAGHMRVDKAYAQIGYRSSPSLFSPGIGSLINWKPECTIRDWEPSTISMRGNASQLLRNSVCRIGTHPVVFMAQGAHALYPYPGQYNFTVINMFENGKEFAGRSGPSGYASSQVLLPSGTDFNAGLRYSLRNLEIGSYLWHSWNANLAYSGCLVDVSGLVNEPFAPHVEREQKPEAYEMRARENALYWDWLATEDRNSLEALRAYLAPQTTKALILDPYIN